MNVFLTGSTGFVGTQILSDLKKEGYRVRALVRRGSESKLRDPREVEVVSGDVTEPESLRGKMAGCDAVIHLVGIIREFPQKGITFKRLNFDATKNIVDTARKEGIQRFLHMSVLGSRLNTKAKYHQTKYLAEEYVTGSGLDYTIFRPSVIFGPEDEFINILANMIKRMPLFPVAGKGDYRLQPVALEDVSTGFINSLSSSYTIGKTYDVGGVEKLKYIELIDIIGRILGKKVRKVYLPIWFIVKMVRLMSIVPGFPITYDQLTMLIGDNTCDERGFIRDFDISPTLFEKGIIRYL